MLRDVILVRRLRLTKVSATQRTTIQAADLAPELIDVQRRLHPLLGTRYRLLNQISDEGAQTASPSWRTYLAQDASLRRKVVLRIANRELGDTRDLHERVSRARCAASLNAHLVAHVYDAVLEGAANRIAPPTTTAIIISEYFEGETLAAALAQNEPLDLTAILAGLAHRVAEAADHDVSFGVLRPEHVILTDEGPAIAALPVGTVRDLGPTSLDALAAGMRTGTLARAARLIGLAGTWRAARRRTHAA